MQRTHIKGMHSHNLFWKFITLAYFLILLLKICLFLKRKDSSISYLSIEIRYAMISMALYLCQDKNIYKIKNI